MRLNIDRPAFLKGRPAPDIRHTVEYLFPYSDLNGIGAQRRQDGLTHMNIGRRETKPPASAAALDNPSHHINPAPQQTMRLLQFAFRNQSADDRTADFILAAFHSANDINDKSPSPARFTEIINRAASVLSKTEIVSYKNFFGFDMRRQITLNKFLRGQLRKTFCKMNNNARIHAQILYQFKPMRQGNDIRQIDLRVNHMNRVRPERHHHGLPAEGPGPLHGPLNQGLMPAMHPVKYADSQYSILQSLSNLPNAEYDFHQCPQY